MNDINSDNTALQLKARLEDKKAKDVLIMDLRGQSAFADFFVLATGTSRPHVAALAEEVDLFVHEQKIKILGQAGLPEANWVVVDAGDLVVHLFQRESRIFYDLEKLWSPQSRHHIESTTPASSMAS